MSNREKDYDEHIAPLMTEIIKIAREKGIPMLASFELDTTDEGPMHVTTYLPTGATTDTLKRALRVIR